MKRIATILSIICLGTFLTGESAQAANAENDYVGSSATGNVTTGSNWSLTHVPTVTEDAVFNASSTAGIKNYGAGATVGDGGLVSPTKDSTAIVATNKPAIASITAIWR